MVSMDVIMRLMRCFPGGFINHHIEFIAHKYSNSYFCLTTCETEMDVKCKVLEYFSRAAYKAQPYVSEKKNRDFNAFMLKGINDFLGTRFTEDDMDAIYTHLGNSIRRKDTIEFIEGGYSMGYFRKYEAGNSEVGA